ncbi:MAG: CatA-like O-acetyltransferase [Oscillospiraceae bacterium]|nr:CatA-like O-acetyltransferase [Oscillospiraceae bacterium]MDY3791003.1 CatA-like O-acetyltransferase [Oscillospiraceae bacterium]MDY6207745.1 CatA-like O-acetyltransferase [Oscillospiraceae bacterium]
MIFTPLDMASYPRREVFMYFSKMAPTGYSITVNVDVTRLRQKTKEQGIILILNRSVDKADR